MNDFLVALSAVFSAIAAGLAAWISWRQWRVSKRQLFCDLLPARLQIVEAVSDLRRLVGSLDAIDFEESRSFLRRLAPCRFLFLDDPGVVERLELIATQCKTVAGMDLERRRIEGSPPSLASSDLARSRFAEMQALKSNLDRATDLLADFIRKQY